MYGLQLITAPTLELVALARAKRHLRVVAPEEEPDVEEAIASAMQQAEERTGRQLLTATYELTLDRFPTGSQPIYPPRPPLQSITYLKYIDPYDDEQTLTENTHFLVDEKHEPGRIVPLPGLLWPASRSNYPGAVRVRYVCGWPSAALVPGPLKDWVLLQLGTRFNFREGILQSAANHLSTFEDGLLLPYVVGDEFWNYDAEKRAESEE